MDDSGQPSPGADLTLQGPHQPVSASRKPDTFLPLKLVLQPDGLSVQLTRPDMLLGRHSTADIRLPLPDVSRRHCRFVFQDGVWEVLDLESLNGLYVNGEKVQQAALHDQDILGIGGFQFKVILGDGSQANPALVDELRQTTEVIKGIAASLQGPHGNIDPPQRKAS